MTVAVWNILDLDEEAGEEGINALVSDFTTKKKNEDGIAEELNPDIEDFRYVNSRFEALYNIRFFRGHELSLAAEEILMYFLKFYGEARNEDRVHTILPDYPQPHQTHILSPTYPL